MNFDHYSDVIFSDDYHLFIFDSIGPKGRLKKIVIYSELEYPPDTYNLALGTIKEDSDGNEYIDGNDISDNGDRNKILATVAMTAFTFIDRYPDKKIYFKGSDKIRTRLYQMAINQAYDDLCRKFMILGDLSENAGVYNLQPFKRNINYTGFVVVKKQK